MLSLKVTLIAINKEEGAGDRNRTPNALVRNQVSVRLCYKTRKLRLEGAYFYLACVIIKRLELNSHQLHYLTAHSMLLEGLPVFSRTVLIRCISQNSQWRDEKKTE